MQKIGEAFFFPGSLFSKQKKNPSVYTFFYRKSLQSIVACSAVFQNIFIHEPANEQNYMILAKIQSETQYFLQDIRREPHTHLRIGFACVFHSFIQISRLQL